MDDIFLQWNQLGIIPGPNESLKDYQERAHYCLSLKKTVQKNLSKEIPFTNCSEKICGKSLAKTEELYGIQPSWVPLFRSNYKLRVWQAGVTWIFKLTETSPLLTLIQLKKNTQRWNLYTQEELLSHELCHAARSGFNEPKFEEFMAWQTSNFFFRRSVGPFFQTSFESALFVVFLLTILGLLILLQMIGPYESLKLQLFILMLPFIGILGTSCRLLMRHWQFQSCLQNLFSLTKSKKIAQTVIFRLTDNEIIAFARLREREILTYIEKQTSFRWQIIKHAYLLFT